MFSRSKEENLRAIQELQEYSEGSIALLESLRDMPEVRSALIETWPTVADPRAVAGLAMLLERSGFGADADPVVAGLLTIGTSPALEALIEHLVRYDSAREERDAEAKELRRLRPEEKPSDLWADDVWEKKEQERIAGLRSRFEERAAADDAWMEAFADRLRAFGKAHDLRKPPRNLDSVRTWRTWAVQARDVLPATP